MGFEMQAARTPPPNFSWGPPHPRGERNKQKYFKVSKSANILIDWTTKRGRKLFVVALLENMEIHDHILITKLKLIMQEARHRANECASLN